MNTLNLDQSKRYKALGGPQGQWPQMVWLYRHTKDGPVVGLEYWGMSKVGLLKVGTGGGWELYAAPDVLTVLEWLEQEKGWHYDTERYQSGTLMGKTWLAYPVDGHGLRLASPIRRSTPSALIDAVFARLRKQREEAG